MAGESRKQFRELLDVRMDTIRLKAATVGMRFIETDDSHGATISQGLQSYVEQSHATLLEFIDMLDEV